MARRVRLALLLASSVPLAAAAPEAGAQVRAEGFAAPAEIKVTYSEPSDAGQADRLRDLAVRMKPVADQLEPLTEVRIVIVRSPAELSRRLGGEDALAGVSYVHGILFLSPISWQRNPTEEALEHEMEKALVRVAILQLAGGNRLPDWLESGLVSVLTKRPFAAATAELVAERAPLLLTRFERDDPAVGYWAVRYLVDARGGLTSIRQLLRLTAQRPDSFVENLQLVYGVPAGVLERDWRSWLTAQAEAEKKREGRREGPLVKP